MKKNTFKNLIKEALSDQLSIVQSQCVETPGVTICDLLGQDKVDRLIDAGKILKDITDRPFKPEDIEYMTNIIAIAKREFGNDPDVEDLEIALKTLMNIEGDIAPAKEMASLKEVFDKFKLS